MNPIEEQRAIIDQVYRLLTGSIDAKFDEAKCEVRYDRFDDGSSSIGSKASYQVADDITHCLLKYPDVSVLDEAVPQLHRLIKRHTGGDWNAFTLSVEQDGRVTTKFEYANEGSSA